MSRDEGMLIAKEPVEREDAGKIEGKCRRKDHRRRRPIWLGSNRV